MAVAATMLIAGMRDSDGPQASSSLARGGGGWSAARAYLELRGIKTRTLDRLEFEDFADARVVVVSGTPRLGLASSESDALRRFLVAGGTVVFGYGPDNTGRRNAGFLGVTLEETKSHPRSLNPFTWRREAGQPLRLAAGAGQPNVALPSISFRPLQESGDEVLLKSSDGEPLVVLRAVSAGRLLILPVQTLSNGYLKEPGNAALLEGAIRTIGETGVWAFDEYHHGVVRPISAQGEKSQAALDLFVVQVLIAYALFALALARRFGPAWPEVRPSSGATSSFLMKVAAIHDRLGHHEAVEKTLRERAKELFDIHTVPPRSPKGSSAARLVAFAQHVHREQKERHKS